jgi:copper chaperone CopZ
MKLTGLTCNACKKVSEKRIGAISGVQKVDVSVELGVAVIDSDRLLSVLEVNKVLQDTPYKALEK